MVGTILLILVIWFLLSIPAGLIIGRLLAGSKTFPETTGDIASPRQPARLRSLLDSIQGD